MGGLRRIGSVRLLQDRVYGRRVVPAGAYPVMLDGGAVFVSFSGYPVVPAGTVEPLAKGVFTIATVDRVKAAVPEEFHSREWTIQEFREFLETDPLCLPGPEQRLVFALPPRFKPSKLRGDHLARQKRSAAFRAGGTGGGTVLRRSRFRTGRRRGCPVADLMRATILPLDEVRRWLAEIENEPTRGVVTRGMFRDLCFAVLHYANAAQAGPTREICSECRSLSAVGFHVPDDLWQAAIPEGRREDIFCVACFAYFADRAYLAWDSAIQFYPVSKRTHREWMEVPPC